MLWFKASPRRDQLSGDVMQWISVYSSWVDSYMYDSGTLYVRFKNYTTNGAYSIATAQYDNISFDLWLDFLQAPSKGKFVHAHLIDKPYKLL